MHVSGSHRLASERPGGSVWSLSVTSHPQPCAPGLEFCAREMGPSTVEEQRQPRRGDSEIVRCKASALMGSLTLWQGHHYQVQETGDHQRLSCHFPLCNADVTTVNQMEIGGKSLPRPMGIKRIS